MEAMKRAVLLGLVFALVLALPAAAEGTLTLYDRFTVSRDTEVLDLGNLKIVDLDRLRGYLDRLPRLTQVVMPETRLSVAQLDSLAAAYPGVRFDCSFSFVKGVVSTSQTAYSTLNTLSDKRYTETRFQALKYCPDLRALDLGHNSIRDLSFLYAMPELRVLILADNQITDLTPLASLKHLEYLELFFNDITDISPLAALDQLKDLNLCRNRIEDVTPLLGLKSLQRLWIPDNFLTERQKAELETALPGCRIQYEWSRSTSFGWREHPRFEVIKRIFRSGVYEPLEP